MKVAVIGAGFCGLMAAYRLSQNGHEVAVFEKEAVYGGLASSVEIDKNLQVEKFIHHIFQSDIKIADLIDELGLSADFLFTKSKDGILYNQKIFPFEGVFDLLNFSPLPFWDRLRFGFITLFLKLTKNWKKFDDITAESWIKNWYGNNSYKIIWGPLLESKFGDFAPKVSMAWFWARIYCRSSKLGYLKGGIGKIFDSLACAIEKSGSKIFLSSPVEEIRSEKKEILVKSQTGSFLFDKVIVTIPAPIFVKITPQLPINWSQKIKKIDFLSATSLLLVLKKSFMPFYWLNVNDKNFPFLLVSEHTNFARSDWYDAKKILYLGNYLKGNDQKLSFSKEKILENYLPYLKKINPRFEKDWVEKSFYFKAPFAQHVATVRYLDELPGFETPIKNLYLASMFQVYPFDRGANYAVTMGEEVVNLALQKT